MHHKTIYKGRRNK